MDHLLYHLNSIFRTVSTNFDNKNPSQKRYPIMLQHVLLVAGVPTVHPNVSAVKLTATSVTT